MSKRTPREILLTGKNYLARPSQKGIKKASNKPPEWLCHLVTAIADEYADGTFDKNDLLASIPAGTDFRKLQMNLSTQRAKRIIDNNKKLLIMTTNFTGVQEKLRELPERALKAFTILRDYDSEAAKISLFISTQEIKEIINYNRYGFNALTEEIIQGLKGVVFTLSIDDSDNNFMYLTDHGSNYGLSISRDEDALKEEIEMLELGKELGKVFSRR